MAIHETMSQYYARRAEMERAAAAVAGYDKVRDIHLVLAGHYAEKARAPIEPRSDSAA